MKIFSKEPKFMTCECIKCGGPIEMDANYETAYCERCRMTYVVRNVDKKKRRKRSRFEMVMDFIERERDLKRKDKIEFQKETKEMELKDKKETNRLFIGLFIFLIVMLVTIVLLTSLGILE